ncbi:MAG: EFR1 family ferrodoxin [Thermodesulfobacteriota bacterium]
MKILIIYFSQTGNTLKMAECIRDGIVEVTGPCDLKALREVDADSLAGYDLVGLGTPVFYFQEPFNVRDFLKDLPHQKGRHWFLFGTHGSMWGTMFLSMAEILKGKGAEVVGYHHMYADAFLPFYPYPFVTSGHPDERELEAARAFGREIPEASREIAAGDRDLIPEPVSCPDLWKWVARGFNREVLSQMLPPLRIDLERCTRCGLCEENCPVQGIDIETDPPRIQEPCVYCVYCITVCPTCAIGGDILDLMGSLAPEFAKHYVRNLEIAAAEGRFEWKMDPASIDFSDSLFRQRERKIRERKEKASRG